MKTDVLEAENKSKIVSSALSLLSNWQMERSGYKPHIQGGGSGSGFSPPDSMLYEEPLVRNDIAKKISRRAIRNEAIIKHKEKKYRAAVWVTALKGRVFLLDGMHKVSTCYSNTSVLKSCDDHRNVLSSSVPSSTLEIDSRNESGINEVPSKGYCSARLLTLLPSESNDPNPAQDPGTERCEAPFHSSRSATSRSDQRSDIVTSRYGSSHNEEREDSSILQVLPGMPRTIEEAAHIWRFACPISNGIPLKNFTDAGFRKANIGGYTNKKWKTGQRASLQRLRKLRTILSNSTDPKIPLIFDDKIDEELWKSAIEAFKKTWSGVALTVVLRRVQRQ